MSPQTLRHRTPAKRRTGPLKAAVTLVACSAMAGCAQLGWKTSEREPETRYSPDIATATIPAAPTVQTGVAAWDGDVSAPGRTAAHPTLGLGSWVRVINARTNQAAVVQVTRRLAGARDRDIELSRDAAAAVGALHEGYATVLIEPIDPRQATADERLATRYTPPAQVDTLRYARTPQTSAGSSPNIATASIPSNRAQATATADLIPTPGAPGARYVQVGSFRDLGNAHRALATIRDKGLTTGTYGEGFIQTAYVDGAVFHRVRLGPIESQDAANRALQETQTAGHPGARILKP
ncbi:MAG: SPOR domain-containing protein [Pseudomonadota bacterium]